MLHSSSNDYFIWSFVRNLFNRFYLGYSVVDDGRGCHQKKFTFEESAFMRKRQQQKASVTSVHHYVPQAFFFVRFEER